jgi:hypothetical protein
LAKNSCKSCNMDKTLPTQTFIPKFSHCVTKDWNILGDSEHGGYILTPDCHTCLIQVSKEVKLTLCDSDKKSVCIGLQNFCLTLTLTLTVIA